MIKKRFNKKKTSLNLILKFVFFIFLILALVFVVYQFYSSAFFNKKLIYIIEKFSQNYEYTLKEVKINRLKNIEQSEIENFFTEYYDKSIFLIPIQKISVTLGQNQWIESLTIKSDYKNTISVKINEASPVGIFHNGQKYFLFDNNGEIIDSVNLNNTIYDELIKFKGSNSLYNANLLLDNISLLLINEIEEAVFINNRRWDIKLKNGINLKLSENNISSSLTNFEIIYKNVSNRELLEIESIDLRIPKQAILKFKEKKDD